MPGEIILKDPTCGSEEAISACKQQPASHQSNDIKSIAKMMHSQKEAKKGHKKHKKHQKSEKAKKHKKSENSENSLPGNLISVAQIEEEE